MDNPKKLNKIEQLKIHLKADLHRLISVNTHFHGIKTFEIGEFLDTQTVCEKCKADMPAWHKDQLVHPVMTADTLPQHLPRGFDSKGEKETPCS